MRAIGLALLILVMVLSARQDAQAGCKNFVGSTMDVGTGTAAKWRVDYPASATAVPPFEPSFEKDPPGYMMAVLKTVRPHFKAEKGRLVGSGQEPWWISEWMDYEFEGRERFMGLTKERGPDKGDLAETSIKGSQVWAVNFYNEAGAAALGQVFADPCNPSVPKDFLFAPNSVAIKFLFTDANLKPFEGQVGYLDEGPTYNAMIDPEGVATKAPSENRVERKVQLIQLDFAVRDVRAVKTGWVFGTFVWVGKPKGDGLFDNLVPAALGWANDDGIYDTATVESWINHELDGKAFGWKQRPFLGFNGRANGPADNIRSSCLSCHAASRLPLSPLRTVGTSFKLTDFADPAKVKAHVDIWFKNIGAGELFDPDANNPPENPAVSLDYSLQLSTAIRHMCRACTDGALSGDTPQICINAGIAKDKACAPLSVMSTVVSQKRRVQEELPRQ